MQDLSVHYSSASPEHYTPRHIVDAVLQCLGVIDLDPCSNSHTSPNVPAKRHFTKEDNGLNELWDGNVYMNCPYGREISEWVKHLEIAHKSGFVPCAIALLPARTDTAWFRVLKDYPVCFVNGRLKFSESKSSAPFPSAIFALGVPVPRFVRHFQEIGQIYLPMGMSNA